ncbi:hypothetical protein PG988_001801 [Apiospora saccharicola]
MWETDMARMRDANISYVRVNEFDWSILEPSEGQYNFTLLDRTLELCGKYGLKAIVGTPTATPPNWATEKYDVDFVDVTNTTLHFGSRRHYSFSSFDYRRLSQGITTKLAERYGSNPNVVAWQLDNEFGCHATTVSYDHNAIKRFRAWLAKKYGTIENMSARQGRVFWSSQYVSFETVQSPFLEVYTTNEAHELFAASGDLVNYFRWRQVPFAQEQTLSALFTSDNAEDQGFVEQQILANEDLPLLRAELGNGTAEPRADVVLVFDYTSNWVWAIEPYSGSWDPKSATYKDVALKYTDLLYTFYSSLRRLGLSVDIIDPYQSLDGYKMVVVPSMPIITDAFDKAMASYSGPVIFGPHTGSKDAKFVAVAGLNPGNYSTLSRRLPMRVTRVETPPAFARSGVVYDGKRYNITAREEWIECTRVGADGGSSSSKSNATITYTSRHRPEGKPAACASGDGLLHYLAFNPPVDLLVAYLGDVAAGAGIRDLTGRAADKANDLGKFVRLLRRGNLLWAFNYGVEAAAAPEVQGATMVIGEKGEIPGAGLVVWKLGSGKR